MRSNPAHHLFFYFSTRKYFTMLFKILDFLRSLDRFKVLIRVIISGFFIAWRKNITKIFTYCREGKDGCSFDGPGWSYKCPLLIYCMKYFFNEILILMLINMHLALNCEIQKPIFLKPVMTSFEWIG